MTQIEINIKDLLKIEQRVQVKATPTRKQHYRIIEGSEKSDKVEPEKLNASEKQRLGTTMGNPNAFLTPKKLILECIKAAGGDPNELKYYPSRINTASMPGKYNVLYNKGHSIILAEKYKKTGKWG